MISIGGPKPRALLALLALEVGRVVSTDRIVEDLWPGTPPESAQHAVQVYVSQLRKAIEDRIARRGPGYVLELEADTIDLHRFARLVHEGHESLRVADHAVAADALREALSLWRGPALADFVYEPFAQAEIARLDELRFGALEDRIEADLALGRHAGLVPEIEALVEAQPLRERPRGLLMRALYLSGRQADALAVYRSTRETLVEELGIEPSPELKALESAILRQDGSLAPVHAAVAAPRTRRIAAVLSVGIEQRDDVDLEVEDRDLQALSETAAVVAARHGGITDRLADGSVVAVFGVPVAHEDDPLRAARAAIEIREAMTSTGPAALAAAIDVGEVVAAERGVSGPPIRSSAKLRLRSRAGDVLVSAAASRRIAHAARLEVRGDASALVGLVADAPAFERRRDTPFVGRERELRMLREALKQARRGTSARAVLVVGAPGLGKSRLAAELRRRSRGVQTLSGRCLSYGDGITYWPLRQMLRQAGPSAEREAVLGALDADTPPGATEIAWLFRRLCETMARRKPLVVVFDDLHWAEQTLLDLVEHLVARGVGPILALCLAREELLEERPDLFEAYENVERATLQSLSSDETEALLEHLDGSILEAQQRQHLAERAEGNPFFLEQLVALAFEGGLVERALPETAQALLSARLDRLGPGEQAVLERGSVIGKEFSADDVLALLEAEAVPTAGPHLETLSARGFLSTRGGGSYAFRHALLQEAVYRSAPKRLRAELHERFADRLDESYPDLAELDEFVGYHLEQAHLLRTDLGEADRRVGQLAEDAGARLGAAGFRALKRGDMPATVRLLDRAIPLLPPAVDAHHELMCELAIAQYVAGDPAASHATLQNAIAGAQEAGQHRVELRARIEAAYMRLLTEPQGAANELLALAESSIPTFEALGDDRSLARAWLLIGYVHGGIHGNHKAWEEAEERALVHYTRTTFPPATCVGQIAAAIYWGPTPVPDGIERCTDLLASQPVGYFGRAAVLPYVGGLYAQAGDLEHARELVSEAEETYVELGSATAVIHAGTVRADIGFLVADYAAAERALREQCEFLERTRDRAHLAVRAAKLADALVRQGHFDEAGTWVAISRSNAAADDQSAQLVLLSAEARLLAHRGLVTDARALAEDAVRLADGTDGLNQAANARLTLAEVVRADGLDAEADRAVHEALELFERKGNVVGASAASALLGGAKPA